HRRSPTSAPCRLSELCRKAGLTRSPRVLGSLPTLLPSRRRHHAAHLLAGRHLLALLALCLAGGCAAARERCGRGRDCDRPRRPCRQRRLAAGPGPALRPRDLRPRLTLLGGHPAAVRPPALAPPYPAPQTAG